MSAEEIYSLVYLIEQDWEKDARCKGYPHSIFFPAKETKTATKQAKAVCAKCDAQRECLIWGVETQSEGIFGGTDTEQRKAMLVFLNAKPDTFRDVLDTLQR